MRGGGDGVAVLRNVVVKIGVDISELQKSLNEASKSLNKAGESLTNVGGAMTTGLTLPIAAATAGILKLGVDFDDALDRIRVGTGATGKALEGLHDDFRAVYTRVPAGMAATLKKNVTDFINANIPATIKRLLGISSPAKLLWNFGESVGVGLQKGILSTRNLVDSAAKTLTGAALPDRELQLALAGGQNEQRTTRREIVIELRGGPQELNNNTFKELLRQVLREPEIMRDLDNIGFESLTTRVRPRGGL
ncbi:MAG: hypothetical protein M1571_05635 [Firmicutes bacterium]|nr:hypothetical protein [Bacillota bacterium]